MDLKMKITVYSDPELKEGIVELVKKYGFELSGATAALTISQRLS